MEVDHEGSTDHPGPAGDHGRSFRGLRALLTGTARPLVQFDLPKVDALNFGHSSGARLVPMISRQQLAAVIWIAIVAIAVQLAPAVALAHGGHTHLPISIAAVSHDRGEGGALQLNAEEMGAVAKVNAAGISRSANSSACNDSCCASGFSCCVPVILPEPILRLPSHLKALKLERLGASMRAGIDPEALPKPPKSST
jgi:hypothetical protein